MIRWKLWLVGGLTVALAGALWAWRDEIETRVRYAVQGEQLEQALREAEQDAREQRQLRRKAEDIAEVRAARIEALRARDDAMQDDLREIIRNDDAAAEWADGRLPDAVADRLREYRSGRENGDGREGAAE